MPFSVLLKRIHPNTSSVIYLPSISNGTIHDIPMIPLILTNGHTSYRQHSSFKNPHMQQISSKRILTSKLGLLDTYTTISIILFILNLMTNTNSRQCSLLRSTIYYFFIETTLYNNTFIIIYSLPSTSPIGLVMHINLHSYTPLF